ncbi:MAG: DUF721 domain-containing protein [Candidatus Muiribacteriota bacterium]
MRKNYKAKKFTGSDEVIKPDEVIEKQAFSHLFKNYGKFRGRTFFRILKHWDKLVGKELRNILKINRLQNDILYISVTDSAWMQNISFVKNTLERKINEFDSNIKKIKFEVEKKKSIKRKSEWKINLDRVKIDEKERKKALKIVQKLKDEELKQKFLKLFIKKKKFEKYFTEHGYKICKNCKSVYNDKKCAWCGKN